MATLCPKAEKIIRDNKIYLRPENRQKLATYDPKTQVQWLVNPRMEYNLNHDPFMKGVNEIIIQLTQGRSGAMSTTKTQDKPDEKSPPNDNLTGNIDDSSDSDGPVMDLFGDDDY